MQLPWAEASAERAAHRGEAAAKGHLAVLPDAVRIERADCRTFAWPAEVDCVATDPMWPNLEDYDWVGRFCSTRLRPGGLLLCQCGVLGLANVVRVLSEHLQYVHTLGFGYTQMRTAGRPLGLFCSQWRPVVCFSRGKPDGHALSQRGDFVILKEHALDLHDCQQPVEPWRIWLSGLTRPGDLITDPFAGSGTSGIAALRVGERRWLGTEIDEQRYQIARARLADEPRSASANEPEPYEDLSRPMSWKEVQGLPAQSSSERPDDPPPAPVRAPRRPPRNPKSPALRTARAA